MFLPCGEIVAALRYGRIEITENVGVDTGSRDFLIGAWDKVNTAERLELGDS